MQSTLVVLLTFGILVAIHEWGHFIVARRCGVKVLRFAIGFGPALLRWRDRHDTEFALCALPLGGYVKMLDEREGDVGAQEAHAAFNNKSPQQRIAIALAGPAANFLLAIAAYWFVFVYGSTGIAPIVGDVSPDSPAYAAGLYEGDELLAVDGHKVESWQTALRQLMLRLGDSGQIHLTVARDGAEHDLTAPITRWLSGSEEPDLLQGLGVRPFQLVVEPVLKEVRPQSAAERAGLLAGDRLLSVNGEPLLDWYDWVARVQAAADVPLLVTVQRGASNVVLTLVPALHTNEAGESIGLAGVLPVPPAIPEEFVRRFQYAPHVAFGKALEQTLVMSKFTLQSIAKLIQGLISPKNLSGPITIAKVATASAEHGLVAYLNILAVLSISLGVLNLLPIPVLDGGHIVYHSIEWFKGSPVSERVQAIGMRIGITMVLCLMLFAIVNDISRLV